jgi:hypothetical protein
MKYPILKTKLRKESSRQFSGDILNIQRIPILKNNHYYVVDRFLDGEAPKQFIKAYFFQEGKNLVSNLNLWDGYFAKFGGKSYPLESVLEFTMNRIGDYLGLKMNETRLVVVNGQVRFLSKNFLRKGKKLIHGIELLAEYIEDKELVDEVNKDRKTRRQYMTFEIFEDAINKVCRPNCDEIIDSLIQLVCFDAIVGNNDRHFYNWGLIGDTLKTKNSPPTFAPIYDTARGLLWNITEPKIRELYKQVISGSKYLEDHVSKTKPRLSYFGNDEANHFELLAFLSKRKTTYRLTIQRLISIENEKLVLNNLEQELGFYFTDERKYLMYEILKLRFKKLREVC